MRAVFKAISREALAKWMRNKASAMPVHDGSPTPSNQALLGECTWHYGPDNARMIFSRDSGMHSSGWWKNPDYERCFHLSISFSHLSPLIGVREQLLPQDHKIARAWCELLFRDHVRLLWAEPPFSAGGKARDVWHYRLFCDPHWKPILPRGEVYSRDWTPADWKSWSDVHGVENGDGAFGQVIEKGTAA